LGNPGADREGQSFNPTGGVTGGVLRIVRSGSGLFNFLSLDYSAYDGSNQGSQTLTLSGYLAHALIGTETYTLGNTATFFPQYSNWTTELASVLAGLDLDDLEITLNAGSNGGGDFFNQSVDNIVVTAVDPPSNVPEPGTLSLLGLGLLGAGAMRRLKASKKS
jgi:hypothetical protein